MFDHAEPQYLEKNDYYGMIYLEQVAIYKCETLKAKSFSPDGCSSKGTEEVILSSLSERPSQAMGLPGIGGRAGPDDERLLWKEKDDLREFGLVDQGDESVSDQMLHSTGGM